MTMSWRNRFEYLWFRYGGVLTWAMLVMGVLQVAASVLIGNLGRATLGMIMIILSAGAIAAHRLYRSMVIERIRANRSPMDDPEIGPGHPMHEMMMGTMEHGPVIGKWRRLPDGRVELEATYQDGHVLRANMEEDE